MLYVYRVKAVVDFFGSLGEASDAAEVRMPDSQTVLEPVPPAPAETNTPATGALAITGMARVGETLTADTSGIADADGLSNATFSYQWIRNDGSGDADIAGATGATYTLVDADEGKTIRVRVAFVDDRGHQETRTSAATAATVPALDSESKTEEEDGSVWSATMTAGLRYDGYGYSSYAGGAGELSDTAFDLDGVTYTIKTVVAWGWMYIMVDRELPTDPHIRGGRGTVQSERCIAHDLQLRLRIQVV